MGKGFAILVWTAWGSGLVRINARLLDDGTKDIYGNANNWWAYSNDAEKNDLITELTKGIEHFEIIE